MDGRTLLLDEDMLKVLPLGIAKLATLHMREVAEARRSTTNAAAGLGQEGRQDSTAMRPAPRHGSGAEPAERDPDVVSGVVEASGVCRRRKQSGRFAGRPSGCPYCGWTRTSMRPLWPTHGRLQPAGAAPTPHNSSGAKP